MGEVTAIAPFNAGRWRRGTFVSHWAGSNPRPGTSNPTTMSIPPMSPLYPRRAAVALLALLLGAGTIACKGKKGPGADEEGKGDGGVAVPVELFTLERGSIEGVLRFSANLEAERQVKVLSRAPGQVQSLLVEEGDRVKAGQILVRLEDDEQSTALERIEADLTYAESNSAAQSKLRSQDAVSALDLETAEYELKKLNIARKDAARALRYTKVEAPFAGTITSRLVKAGDFVSPNQVLFELTDFDSIVAKVYVPEKELPLLQPGLSARILSLSAGQADQKGAVERIAPVVDPKSGTIKVTIALPDVGSGPLRPGMFVDVELVTSAREEVVLLPKRALVYDNDLPYAFKLAGKNHVKRFRVHPVLEDRDNVLPAKDFDAGDKVVIAGQIGLKDGALVAPTPGPGAAEGEAKKLATPGEAPEIGKAGKAGRTGKASSPAGDQPRKGG